MSSWWSNSKKDLRLFGITHSNNVGNLGLVYTKDHEIGSWKMAFFHDLT